MKVINNRDRGKCKSWGNFVRVPRKVGMRRSSRNKRVIFPIYLLHFLLKQSDS